MNFESVEVDLSVNHVPVEFGCLGGGTIGGAKRVMPCDTRGVISVVPVGSG